MLSMTFGRIASAATTTVAHQVHLPRVVIAFIGSEEDDDVLQVKELSGTV